MPNRAQQFLTTEKYEDNPINTDMVGGNLEDLIRRAAIEWMTAEILKPPIVKPVITSVSSSGQWYGTTYETSELFTGIHTATSVEVASDDSFTQIIYSSMSNTTNLETGTIQNAISGNSYYIRIRYESNYYASGWSDAVGFTFT